MKTKDQKADTVEESGGSIGLLRASEKMWISTCEVPLIFLEDLGFSKKKIQAAKDFNRKFVSGFFGRVGKIGEKLSFSRHSSEKVAEEKSGSKKTKSMKATSSGGKAIATKAKPAGPTARAKTPEGKNAPANIAN